MLVGVNRLLFLSLLIFSAFYSSSAFALTFNYYETSTIARSTCDSARGSSCPFYSSGSYNKCASGSFSSWSNADTVYIGCTDGGSNCTGGRTLQLNGSCGCSAGQTWDGTSCIVPIVQDCSKGQYRLTAGGTCQAIPDCNAGVPDGNSYFDVNASPPACSSPQFPSLVCGGSHSVACEPISDCISPGVACSNNPADITDTQQTQPARNAAAKTDAQNSQDQSAQNSQDAQASASAKQADSTAKQADAQAAESAAQQSAATDPNSQQTIDALHAAAQAAAAAADAAAKAANAQLSAQQTLEAAQRAAAENAKISPSYGGGLSENAAEAAHQALQDSIDGLIRALNGQAPIGEGVGNTGTCPDCAKDSTLKDLITGTAKSHAGVEQGSFDPDAPQSAAADAKVQYQAKFDEVRAGVSSLFSFSDPGTAGELPIIDFGIIKGQHVIVDLNQYAGSLSIIGLTILSIAGVLAVMIFLS